MFDPTCSGHLSGRCGPGVLAMPTALEESRLYLQRLNEQYAMTEHCLQQSGYHLQQVQAISDLVRISEQLSVLPKKACLDCVNHGITALEELNLALRARHAEIRNQITAECAIIESMEQSLRNREDSSTDSQWSSPREQATWETEADVFEH